MSRYSLATALLYLFTIVNNAHAHESTKIHGPWSYLPEEIPTPLSDMSVDMLTLNGNTEQSIILTGGCDSADGNVYYEADWGEGFACSSVTSKVSPCSAKLFIFMQILFFNLMAQSITLSPTHISALALLL